LILGQEPGFAPLTSAYGTTHLKVSTVRPIGSEEVRMRTHLTLQPGQDGAKRGQARYSDRLVCVCYRYAERQRKSATSLWSWLSRNGLEAFMFRQRRPASPDSGRVSGRSGPASGQGCGRNLVWQVWELRYEYVVAW